MNIVDNKTITSFFNSSIESDVYGIVLSKNVIIGTSIYYVFLLPFSILGNVLAISVSLRILIHRKSIPDLLTLCLATSDLVCVLSVHLPVLVALAAGEWMGGIYTCAYQYYMAWSCLKLSFFILVLMTIDRYLALCKPFYYRSRVKQRKVLYAVISLTAFSYLSTSLTIICHSHTIFILKTWYMCMNTWSSTDPYNRGVLIFYGSTFVVFSGVFNYCNTAVVKWLRKRSNGKAVVPALSNARQNRESRFAKIIILLSVVFVIAWTPYLVGHRLQLFLCLLLVQVFLLFLYGYTLTFLTISRMYFRNKDMEIELQKALAHHFKAPITLCFVMLI